jgi:DeoR family transcriptional regulator of aga operon
MSTRSSTDQEKQRRRRILAIIGRRGQFDKEELSELLGVDPDTVEHDLEQLAAQVPDLDQAKVDRHLDHLPADIGFHQRTLEHQQEKARIGRAAADLINDGETIFLASGSTVHEVASNLIGKKLTAVTNSLPVMSLLAQDRNMEVVSVGGVLRRSEMSFIGNFLEQTLGRMHIEKVVLGIYALDLIEGLTQSFIPETITDRTILEAGNEVIIVADHSKIGRRAATFIAPLSKIDVLVTDDKTPQEAVAAMEAQGIRVVIA